jgi:hypothetical protein
MSARIIVDCDLRNGRGYVVLSDASEFEIVLDPAGLHIRSLCSDEEISDPAMHDAIHRHLACEHLLSA